MNLSQIIDVQITRETQVPSQAGFGTPAILGASDRFGAGERIRRYSDLDSVIADFTGGDPEIQAATSMLSQVVKPPEIVIIQKEAGDADLVTALTEARKIDDDWYGLYPVSRLEADINALAAYVEAQIKLMLATSSDAAVPAGTAGNVAEDLNAASYDRTSLWYSGDAAADLGAGLLGRQLPQDPGSTNWAHKTINGITYDNLNNTEIAAIEAVKGNFYTRVAGLNKTFWGTVASGEYLDVIRGSDFIQARIQELVFFEMSNSEKIPFTDQGIAKIEQRLREGLGLGVANQIINPDFTIFVPKAADISVLDKGNRFLQGLDFEATLTGAINKAKIVGRLVL